MVRKVAGGLAALGLIGGAGAVAYRDDGSAKVTITDSQGREQSVIIEGDGRPYSCPAGTDTRLEPVDIRAGRIKITLRHVRRDIRDIERRYPDQVAPGAVVDRYNRLIERDDRLVDAFNRAIGRHNAILAANCEPE